jgi:hypothetical protein
MFTVYTTHLTHDKDVIMREMAAPGGGGEPTVGIVIPAWHGHIEAHGKITFAFPDRRQPA